VTKLEEYKNDWRRLCEVIAKETDSRELHQLLDQLTQALNARAEELDVASKSSAPRSDDIMTKKKDDG
jgi:archaellum biogenesis protein FlaJ (TadC family)